MHSDQFKPILYLKLIKKYIFSEGEQFPLRHIDRSNPNGDLKLEKCNFFNKFGPNILIEGIHKDRAELVAFTLPSTL